MESSQADVYEYLKKVEMAKTKEIAEVCDINESNAWLNLRKLFRQGIVKKVFPGGRRSKVNTHWCLVETPD